VAEPLRLPGGAPFPLPVVLDLTRDEANRLSGATRVALVFNDNEVGELELNSIFQCDKPAIALQVFGTRDPAHPGVSHFLRMGDSFAGGRVQITRPVPTEFGAYALTPAQVRAQFASSGWQTICGFQTRNVPHRAHEHLQRLALECCDALFIQPLVGARKRGDYTPNAILTAYEVLIAGFLPADRIVLGVLSTAMRYAGPREAIFHAIVRRNYGCTHFVVGRDHAGVGSYYGKYDAHELARRFEGELGIEILRFHGPFYCRACASIVTERSCPHLERDPREVTEVSGTLIRAMLREGTPVRPELLRPEIVERLRGIQLFIDEDAE